MIKAPAEHRPAITPRPLDGENRSGRARRLVFGDIDGKLEVPRVECTKCDRTGRHSVARLIAKHGRMGNMMKWKEQLNADCPKQEAHSLHDRCDLLCPDLPKVL
jgi:hypothetical protein